MRVALTGASGFVGQAVLARLHAGGHQVKTLRRTAGHASSNTAVIGDLADRDALSQLVDGVDVVVHVAGAVRAPSTAAFHAVNATGAVAVAEAARAAGVKRLVHISSLAARRPGISGYAASKKAAEDALFELRGELDVLILRPSAVYGPGDQATLPLLKSLMSKVAVLPGRRDARFSLIHVDDLADVIVSSAASNVTGLREIDDLEGGHDWAELVSLCRAQFGRPGTVMHLPYGPVLAAGYGASVLGRMTRRGFVFGAGKVRELYERDWCVTGENWPRSNAVSLAKGLPQTIQWFQDKGLLPKTDFVGKG